MKFFYYFLFNLLLALPVTLFAQSNYHQGYILKNNGDTLKGFINYREWDISPKSIDFKFNSGDKEVLKFAPQVVKGFQINDMDTYIVYKGNISMDKNNFPDLPTGLDTAKKLDTIFLKQVTTGENVTLYYNNDNLKKRYFIAEKDNKPVELIYHEYYSVTEGENKEEYSTLYRGQFILYITKYAPDNAKLIPKLGQLRFTEDNLEAFVNKLNNKVVESKKSPHRLFIGAEINHTITEVNTLHSTTVSPKINFGIDVFTNPNVQKLILRAQLSFSYITPRFNDITTMYGTSTHEEYSFNQYTATITPQIIYNIYNADRFKFYLDVGIGLNFSAYGNNKIISSDNNRVQTTDRPYQLEHYWANFPFQIGMVLNKRTEISFTYTGYNAYTQYTDFYASNRSISLGVKFLLNKN